MITLSYIASKLENEGYSVGFQGNNETDLKGVLLLGRNEQQYLENYLYLLNKNEIMQLRTMPMFCVILSNKQEVSFIGNVPNFICISNNVSVTEVFKKIQKIFEEYSEWRGELLESIVHNRSLQTVLDISYKIFKNPMYILDSSQTTLAYSRNIETKANDILWNSISEKGYVDFEVMKLIIYTKYLNYLDNLHEPIFFTHKRFSYRCIVVNIRINDYKVGSLGIIEVDATMNDAYLNLANELVDCISSIIKMESLFHMTQGTVYESWILDILENKELEDEVLEYKLSLLGWKQHERFGIGVMKCNEDVETTISIPFYCKSVMRLIPGSKAFIYKNNLVVVFNGDSNRNMVDEKKLSNFLIRGNILCGFSNWFDDFLELGIRYKQACQALKCASKDVPLQYYRRCMVQHICNEFSSKYDLNYYIQPEVKVLWEYDKTHNSDLVKTLYYYLIYNRSLNKCAKKLLIHRSTFVYRLNRISLLSGI
ncbi:helix-turn-helix domain-containing protein, partial [Clostridium sp. A1-XYC3]